MYCKKALLLMFSFFISCFISRCRDKINLENEIKKYCKRCFNTESIFRSTEENVYIYDNSKEKCREIITDNYLYWEENAELLFCIKEIEVCKADWIYLISCDSESGRYSTCRRNAGTP
jgi:hypothetical protein